VTITRVLPSYLNRTQINDSIDALMTFIKQYFVVHDVSLSRSAVFLQLPFCMSYCGSSKLADKLSPTPKTATVACLDEA